MAVPGADKRKSADGHWTVGADSAARARQKTSGVSAAFGPSGFARDERTRAAGMEAVAHTPGRHNVQPPSEPAETNDGSPPAPPAIKVVGGSPVVAWRPDAAFPVVASSDRSFSGRGGYIYSFVPDPGRRRTVIVE